MIGKIKKGLKKRKVKIFLVFLLCSTLAWFINTLSETYEHSAVLDLNYVNVPDDLMLRSASRQRLNAKLSGIGFQFLKYSLIGKRVNIDLSKMNKEGSYYMTQNSYRQQVESQISRPMKLVSIANDTLFFDFQELVSKRVPIEIDMDFSLAQNYMLDGVLVVIPDSITVKGPREEVDAISKVKSSKIGLKEMTVDFSKDANLIQSTSLKYTTYSEDIVNVSGIVFKFSEKNMVVQIEAINLPIDRGIKMFPNVVTVLCKGNLEVLKSLKSTDFRVVADYNLMNTEQQKVLPVTILKKPSKLHSAVLKNRSVEYILERN